MQLEVMLIVFFVLILPFIYKIFRNARLSDIEKEIYRDRDRNRNKYQILHDGDTILDSVARDSDSTEEGIGKEIAKGNMVKAVRLCSSLHGVSLKEAADAISKIK